MIRCFSVTPWMSDSLPFFWKDWVHWKARWQITLIWINSRQMSRKPTAVIQFRQDFWTETDKLKGKHVGNMLSGRWRRSSVSAAAYSSTLTTELLLCSDQILTRLTASLHVTYDSSTDLSTDKSQNVKTEVKKVSFSVTTLCLSQKSYQYGFRILTFFGWHSW